MDTKQALDFLVSRDALAPVFQLWCDIHEDFSYNGKYYTNVSAMALIAVLRSADERVLAVYVPGAEIFSGGGIRTRSVASSSPSKYEEIPLYAKITKLLIREYGSLAEDAKVKAGGGDEEYDVEGVSDSQPHPSFPQYESCLQYVQISPSPSVCPPHPDCTLPYSQDAEDDEWSDDEDEGFATKSVFAPAEDYDLSEAFDLGKFLHEDDVPDEDELEDPLYQVDLMAEIAQMLTELSADEAALAFVAPSLTPAEERTAREATGAGAV
jgi:hypothetical protein